MDITIPIVQPLLFLVSLLVIGVLHGGFIAFIVLIIAGVLGYILVPYVALVVVLIISIGSLFYKFYSKKKLKVKE